MYKALPIQYQYQLFQAVETSVIFDNLANLDYASKYFAKSKKNMVYSWKIKDKDASTQIQKRQTLKIYKTRNLTSYHEEMGETNSASKKKEKNISWFSVLSRFFYHKHSLRA